MDALPSELVKSLRIDYQHGMRQAVQLLAALGHVRIAFISGPVRQRTAAIRRAAFQECMTEIGLRTIPELLFAGDQTMEGGVKAMSALGALPDRPSAVICSNDLTAIGVMRQAFDLSVDVPRDLSVIGFEDIRMAQFTIPALTAVEISQTVIAETAFRALLQSAQSPRVDGASLKTRQSFEARFFRFEASPMIDRGTENDGQARGRYFTDWLPRIRRDNRGRSRDVVHNIGVKHDLQVLPTPIFRQLPYKVGDHLWICDEVACGVSPKMTEPRDCYKSASSLSVKNAGNNRIVIAKLPFVKLRPPRPRRVGSVLKVHLRRIAVLKNKPQIVGHLEGPVVVKCADQHGRTLSQVSEGEIATEAEVVGMLV